MTTLEELWKVVSSIPSGSVASYGDVGSAMSRPVSGVLVGKWMAQCPSHVPWWRVVGRSGDLLVAKRDAVFAAQQKQKLIDEGVVFDGEAVRRDFFYLP